VADHEHQFPEEETPEGVRLLLPCLECGVAALDGLKDVIAERDDLLAWIRAYHPEALITLGFDAD
jgi:hypothetical protein